MIERPFVSLGSHLNLALSSLDKYIEQVKQSQTTTSQTLRFPTESHNDTVESLQKEQSQLCEELNIERRRTENLNATFSRAISFNRQQFQAKLESIKHYLLNAQKQTLAVVNSLNYLNEIQIEIENADSSKISELAQQAKESEIFITRQRREIKALKRELVQINSEIKILEQQINDATTRGEEIAAQRKENKAELHKFLEQVKIEEAQWKDRVNTLQEQLTIGEE